MINECQNQVSNIMIGGRTGREPNSIIVQDPVTQTITTLAAFTEPQLWKHKAVGEVDIVFCHILQIGERERREVEKDPRYIELGYRLY
jgi:hypothetical protein